MPIRKDTDPPGRRILTRISGGDDVDEEQIREWSPNGNFVKMRFRSGFERWELKNNVDNRMVMALDDVPPVIAGAT